MKSLIWIASILAAALAAFGVYWFVIRKPETPNPQPTANSGLPTDAPNIIPKTGSIFDDYITVSPTITTASGKVIFYRRVATDNTVTYYDSSKNLIAVPSSEMAAIALKIKQNKINAFA